MPSTTSTIGSGTSSRLATARPMIITTATANASVPAVQLIGAVRPGPGDTTGRTAFTRRGAIICCSGETTELVTVLKVSGCLGAGQVDDDGQLNQPLPGPDQALPSRTVPSRVVPGGHRRVGR